MGRTPYASAYPLHPADSVGPAAQLRAPPGRTYVPPRPA